MASHERSGKLALIGAVCLMLLPIHTLPIQAEENRSETNKEEAVVTPAEESNRREGIASYYAKRYNGRRTTSGVRYNPEKMTAAHSDLPLGTKVKVTNLANDKEVIVTVNDRCRKRKGAFIDLSRAAAKKLGFLGKGIARVAIITFDEEES
jgi:rare lipoprotein A